MLVTQIQDIRVGLQKERAFREPVELFVDTRLAGVRNPVVIIHKLLIKLSIHPEIAGVFSVGQCGW